MRLQNFPRGIWHVFRDARLFVFAVLMLAAAMVSCVDEEKFNTAPGDKLTFSQDTLTMDTVISGMKSIMRGFTIYNNNSDGVSITNVEFLGGKSNGFDVIVDGVNIINNLPASIDCRSKDSLLAYVRITPEVSNQDDKVYHEATLVFTLANGRQQNVVLSAYSQDVIWLNAEHITVDGILDAKRPYVVKDSLTVEKGATLTLKHGVRLMFQANAFLKVDGTLRAEGTLENPVVLRGDRMDFMFENQPYDRIPSQWGGVIFTENSSGNYLNYCDVHSGSFGLLCQKSEITDEILRIENSIVHNMAGNCIETYGAKIFVGNSQITNAGEHCVALYGGDNTFVHCTIAQFYPFETRHLSSALYYANHVDKETCPLYNAAFYNCIITGYSDDEISGDKMDTFNSGAFNYKFVNCLLNTPEVRDDDNVVDNVWDVKKNEVSRAGNFPNFDLKALYYDFKLDSLSVAIGAADPNITNDYYPADRLGKKRLDDGRSDAGCYER